MKYVIGFLAMAVMFTACQQKKQYFTSAPEIDLVKKVDQSYASADWETLRGTYADTTKIWLNTWGGQDAISVDTLMARLQTARANYTDVKMGEPIVYEMIETDDGTRWVHRWTRWDVTHKNGKSFSYPSHASFMVSDGKIRGAGYIFNALPGYLANQDSTAKK